MSSFIKTWVLFLLIIMCQKLSAQTISNITNFDLAFTSNGDKIRNISLDSNGYLILSTNTGEYYFDGNSSYKIKDNFYDYKEKLHSNFKGPIKLISGNALFYSELDGIRIVDKNLNVIHDIIPGISNCDLGPNKIQLILEDSKGQIWIISYRDGLYKWTPENHCIEHIIPKTNQGTSIFEIRRLIQHNCDNDKIILAHTMGVSMIDINDNSTIDIYSENKFEPTIVKFKTCDTLLIGTWFNGINIIDIKQSRRSAPKFAIFKDLVLDQINRVSGIHMTENSTYVAINKQGIYQLKQDTLIPILKMDQNTIDLLSSVNRMIVDDYNNVWITSQRQLSKGTLHDKVDFKTIYHEGAKFFQKIENNEYVSGGSSNEIIIFDSKLSKQKSIKIENNTSLSNERNLLFSTVNSSNQIYFAGNNSLFKIDSSNQKLAPLFTHIFDTGTDRSEPRNLSWFQNRLVVPTKREGIVFIEPKTGVSEKVEIRSHSIGPIWHFYRDIINQGDTILWVTSENGLAKYVDSTSIAYYTRQSTSADGSLIGLTDRICLDQKGMLWSVNDQGEILSLRDTIFTKSGFKIGDYPVRTIQFTTDGTMWILAPSHLYYFDPSANRLSFFNELNHVSISKIQRLTVQGNDVILSGNNGHLIFNSSHISKTTNNFNINLLRYQVDQNIFYHSGKKKITLPSTSKFLRLDYIVTGNIDANNIQSSYRINKNNWQPTDKNHVEVYNLSQGRYDIEFCINHRADPNQNTCHEIEFIIEKPWYLNAINQLLLSLASIFIIGVISFLIIRKIKLNAKKKIKKIQEEESKLTEYNTKIAELEMQSLQNQMNPHFIFNSINSLKLMILNDDGKKGAQYLQKFSRMVRTILQNSRKKLISLEDELKLLKIYSEFEQLRFGKEIVIKYSISNTLDTSFIKLPPMILQPYVENAIWHGLLHLKERKPKLKIECYDKNDDVICKIIDNGIGRKASTLMKSKSSSHHKSLGQIITQERLDIYEKITGKKINIDYIDHNQIDSFGTTVIVTFNNHN